MKKFMSVLAAFLVLGLLFGSVGCNTVEGVGKDVEATGEAIEDAAN